jgi:vitamin B12 transporter
MFVSAASRLRFVLGLMVLSLLFVSISSAQSTGSLHGKVMDTLGTPIPGATVTLLQDNKEIIHVQADADGVFKLDVAATGRYVPQIEAKGFSTQTLAPVFLESGKREEINVTLQVGPLTQQIVVSATGTALPEAQVGASVNVVDHDQIQALNKLDVLEDLRIIPGAQVVQSSQRGGAASLFIRGGASNFNKILVDGIPVNEIGGTFDFAQLSNTGVENVEVLSGSNSVLYGADALSGVVNITSQRGTTPLPQVQYTIDGGNFGTLHEDVSLGGKIRNFDYFSEFSRFDTQGSFQNDFFHNATTNSNFGWQITPTTGFRVTARYTTADLGAPNAIAFYGISDDSTQRNQNLYVGATLQQQTTDRWHNTIQVAFAQFSSLFDNPSPTGQPFDGGPFVGVNFLGNTVTIKGANGFSVTGQAILDFGGTYPMIDPDYEARRSLYAQTDYRVWGDWTAIAGFRYEHEDGEGLTRNNYSTFLEGHGSIWHRLFLTAGVGLERNAVFGFAASPRLSGAYYIRKPTAAGFFGETKFKANFGKGIKEPSTFEQASALFAVLTPAQIAQFNVSPIGPERSKTTDFGIDQRLWNDRAILSATLFYNQFYDLISFLSVADLVSIGVPPGAAEATPFGGGAYVNATSERAMGAEFQYKMQLGHGFMFQGTYTYLDAVVTKAFGDPSFNPMFPTIPIGAFSPLQGDRPFRQAPHSGSIVVTYNRRKFNAALTGSFIGRRNDSTFLDDGFFGNTMLLPNKNLAPAYQKVDLSAGYDVKPWVRVFSSIENLFDEHYQPVFGFPALPFSIRGGMKFTFGGEHGFWK